MWVLVQRNYLLRQRGRLGWEVLLQSLNRLPALTSTGTTLNVPLTDVHYHNCRLQTVGGYTYRFISVTSTFIPTTPAPGPPGDPSVIGLYHLSPDRTPLEPRASVPPSVDLYPPFEDPSVVSSPYRFLGDETLHQSLQRHLTSTPDSGRIRVSVVPTPRRRSDEELSTLGKDSRG